MSALPLLAEFFDKHIKVRVEGDEIALSAPKGALTPHLVSRVKEEKARLLVSLSIIREKAGDDWEDIVSDPDQLKTIADILVIEDMRYRGIVPDHYTATAECRRCGPVPLWEECPPQVSGCPWCFNRVAGLPMPGVPK